MHSSIETSSLISSLLRISVKLFSCELESSTGPRRWAQCRSIDVRVQSDSPPRPNQFANSEDHNTSNQKQKDRHCQVGLLLEFLEPFVDPRRSPEKDGTNKEIEWNSGGNEGYDLEKHRPLWPACTGTTDPRGISDGCLASFRCRAPKVVSGW